LRFAVQNLRSVRCDPFLAADIIAGFPGETESEFENTIELLSQLDFAWIHAFPFSLRPDTRAASMKPRIPERIAGERVKRLLGLARQGKEAYVNRWIGKCVEMVIEHERRGIEDSQARLIIGTTENYLKAMIEESESVAHKIIPYRPGGSVKVVLNSMSESALPDGGVEVLAKIAEA